MANDAEVTREHREAATTALMLGVSDEVLAFECTGETHGDEHLEGAARVAQAIANDARASRAGGPGR